MSFVMKQGVKIRGRYEIEKALGKGGLGHSYLAKDLYRSTDVVIKVIGIGSESRYTALRPWDDALSALRRLSHGGVPSILDQFSFDEDREGYVALVQELVHGQSLEDLVKSQGPLSTEACRDLTLGLLDTLDYLHSQKVPHGAVRPATVLLEDPKDLGRSQLAGFVLLNHIAHRLGQKDAYGSAKAYIRPHMYQEENISPAGDTFSLALTVYFALTGQHPPEDPHAIEDFDPAERLGANNPWVDFMEECFQGQEEGHYHRLRDLVPTLGPSNASGGAPPASYEEDSREYREAAAYSGEVRDPSRGEGRFPAQQEGEFQDRPGDSSSVRTTTRTEHSERVEFNGKVVMENGVITPEAQEELDKLPAFLRDKVLSAIRENQGSQTPPSDESFATIKDRVGSAIGLASKGEGYAFSIPKTWVNYFLGVFTLGIGGVFTSIFVPLLIDEFAEIGFFGFVFLMFAAFPLLGIISMFGKSTVELYRDRIVRRFTVFGIQTIRKEIPLSEIQDIFINRVRGSKGGVTHYLCLRQGHRKINIGNGMGGVDKNRQDILDLVRSWWLENKR